MWCVLHRICQDVKERTTRKVRCCTFFINSRKNNKWYTDPNETNSSVEYINEQYKNFQRVLPLNEDEILRIRNILISLGNKKRHTGSSVSGIPSFFLLDTNVRNHFLNYLNDETSRTFSCKLREGFLNGEQEQVNKLVKDFFREFLKKCYYRQWIFFEQIKKMCDFTEVSTLLDKWENKNKVGSRTWYVYVGPTNSGKTYEAVQKMIYTKNAIYCAPLRVLAWEVYNKINQLGLNTNLLTGQEIIKKENSSHTICTIEMTPLNVKYDVAVIDEIQMIQDGMRGFAWTNVLMYLQCKELYLCGSEDTVPLLQKLCDLFRDQIIIKRFTRLSKLNLEENELSLEKVTTGDCIIAFSKSSIMTLKKKLHSLNKQVVIIYGSLPPEAKQKQIEYFNERCQEMIDNESLKESKEETVLVATDVIGMGINTRIRRIIFYSLKKYDGDTLRYLTLSEIVQIAGRAGRFDRNRENETGYVTCVHPEDHAILKKLFKNNQVNLNYTHIEYNESKEEEEESSHSRGIKEESSSSSSNNNSRTKAGFFPDFNIIEQIGKILEFEKGGKVKLHEILTLLIEYIQLNKQYFFLTKNYNQMVFIAKYLKDVSLDHKDLFIYTLSPIKINNILILNVLKLFCLSHSLLGYVEFFECIQSTSIGHNSSLVNFSHIINHDNHIEKEQMDTEASYLKEEINKEENTNMILHNLQQSSVHWDEYIAILEIYYDILDLYCWLHTRFRHVYRNIDLVTDEKKKTAIEISNILRKPFEEKEFMIDENECLNKLDIYFLKYKNF